jgi:long-subunit acyl-CoA synthetase (AMP-forming)
MQDAVGLMRSQGSPGRSCRIVYTSGRPEGVILTHRNLLRDPEALERTGDFDYEYQVASTRRTRTSPKARGACM